MRKAILFILVLLSFNLVAQRNLISVDDFVSHWVGKKYRFGGTSEFTGIDCSAFTQRFYGDVYGVKISRTCFYQYKESQRIEKQDLQTGDIVFFDSKVSPSRWHAGIYIGEGEFIHSANFKDGVKISCLYDDPYDRIYKGAGRPKTEIR